MTLKIEKMPRGTRRSSARAVGYNWNIMDELKTQSIGDQPRTALGLDEVTLMDVEVVRFLNGYEEGGVELLHLLTLHTGSG